MTEFHAAIAGYLLTGSSSPPPSPARRSDPVGLHRLRDGSFACGIGLAFGHADAQALQSLSRAATAAGARSVRATPARALLLIGLAPHAAEALVATANALGFVVRADDPRRRVIACPGAPICSSAHIAARALAPRIATLAAPWLAGDRRIHISGCAKGCAHPAPAALTIVGTEHGCMLVADGAPSNAAFAHAAPQDLPAAVARYVTPKRGW